MKTTYFNRKCNYAFWAHCPWIFILFLASLFFASCIIVSPQNNAGDDPDKNNIAGQKTEIHLAHVGTRDGNVLKLSFNGEIRTFDAQKLIIKTRKTSSADNEISHTIKKIDLDGKNVYATLDTPLEKDHFITVSLQAGAVQPTSDAIIHNRPIEVKHQKIEQTQHKDIVVSDIHARYGSDHRKLKVIFNTPIQSLDARKVIVFNNVQLVMHPYLFEQPHHIFDYEKHTILSIQKIDPTTYEITLKEKIGAHYTLHFDEQSIVSVWGNTNPSLLRYVGYVRTSPHVHSKAHNQPYKPKITAASVTNNGNIIITFNNTLRYTTDPVLGKTFDKVRVTVSDGQEETALEVGFAHLMSSQNQIQMTLMPSAHQKLTKGSTITITIQPYAVQNYRSTLGRYNDDSALRNTETLIKKNIPITDVKAPTFDDVRLVDANKVQLLFNEGVFIRTDKIVITQTDKTTKASKRLAIASVPSTQVEKDVVTITLTNNLAPNSIISVTLQRSSYGDSAGNYNTADTTRTAHTPITPKLLPRVTAMHGFIDDATINLTFNTPVHSIHAEKFQVTTQDAGGVTKTHAIASGSVDASQTSGTLALTEAFAADRKGTTLTVRMQEGALKDYYRIENVASAITYAIQHSRPTILKIESYKINHLKLTFNSAIETYNGGMTITGPQRNGKIVRVTKNPANEDQLLVHYDFTADYLWSGKDIKITLPPGAVLNAGKVPNKAQTVQTKANFAILFEDLSVGGAKTLLLKFTSDHNACFIDLSKITVTTGSTEARQTKQRIVGAQCSLSSDSFNTVTLTLKDTLVKGEIAVVTLTKAGAITGYLGDLFYRQQLEADPDDPFSPQNNHTGAGLKRTVIIQY